MDNTLVFNARDAKTRFGELLDESLGQPVAIKRHDRLVSYVVSVKLFDSMRERLQQLEDDLWVTKAEQAASMGYASREEVNAFLNDLKDVNNVEAGTHKPGAKVSAKPGRKTIPAGRK